MIYERWPDVDEPAYLTPEDHWPDADTGQAPPTLDDLVKAASKMWGSTARGFMAAMEPLMRTFASVPKDKAKALREAMDRGYITYYDSDEFTIVKRTPEIDTIIDGYKTLKNGRKMPVLPHNTGPRRDPFKNRGLAR